MEESQGESEQSPTAVVARIVGNDPITVMHVENFLASHGIDAGCGGSRRYGVFVRRTDADKANRLLREDALKRKYWIELPPDPLTYFIDFPVDEHPYVQDKGKWETISLNRLVAEAIDNAGFPELKRVLQCYIHGQLGFLEDKIPLYDYVQTIEVLKREYCGEDGTLKEGYEMRLAFADDPNDDYPNAEVYLQVWNGGDNIKCLGGRY